MEMEDEKNAEANSAYGDDLTEDENLNGDQYEITVEDVDSGELDFDIVDYNELEGVTAGRRIDKGSFAIQAHDPKSVVRYRNIMVKPFN